jgi:hypothetical protein
MTHADVAAGFFSPVINPQCVRPVRQAASREHRRLDDVIRRIEIDAGGEARPSTKTSAIPSQARGSRSS